MNITEKLWTDSHEKQSTQILAKLRTSPTFFWDSILESSCQRELWNESHHVIRKLNQWSCLNGKQSHMLSVTYHFSGFTRNTVPIKGLHFLYLCLCRWWSKMISWVTSNSAFIIDTYYRKNCDKFTWC